MLLQEHLRKDWGFHGYVVSDCGAVTDVFNGHKFAKTPEEGVTDTFKAGTDLICGAPRTRVQAEREATFNAVKQGLLPQSVLVLLGTGVIVLLLWLFMSRTLTGKAMIATAANRLAARLVGINTSRVVALAFAISAAIGAIGGILVTPIALTSYDAGTLLALKGFAAAMLGGIGSPIGAVAGGLIVGLLVAFGAGYVSSAYKDAIAFLVILAVLFAMPQGLFGRGAIERV